MKQSLATNSSIYLTFRGPTLRCVAANYHVAGLAFSIVQCESQTSQIFIHFVDILKTLYYNSE